MATPSAAAMQVLTGAMAPAVIPDPECVELKKATDKKRSEISSKTKDKTVAGKDLKGKGTTVSAMKSTPKAGGMTKTRLAHNNNKAHMKCPSAMAKGASSDARKGKKTPLCPSSSFSHPDPAMQKSGHAEARLLGELGAAKPRSITLSIDWIPGNGAPSKMPCEDCHKMLCAAKTECGHDISLCDSKGQKHELSDDHCPATPASYDALRQTMGES